MNQLSFFSNQRRSSVTHIIAVLVLVTATVLSTFAQTSRGSISGVVKDPSGAVVPGASVTVVSESTSVERTTTTNDEGLYRFEALDLGTYTVRVAAPNFSTASRTGVTVVANQTVTIDADLQVGNQQAVVEVVSGGTEPLQTESAVRGGNISPRQISDLPVGNIAQLALTIPGVSTNRTGLGNNTFSVNGARGRSNNFLIDGTENNDISVAGQGFEIANQDAVQEVSVQTGNYDAEFGRAGGAIVNVITKSGTRDFRGTLGFRYDTSTDDAITAAQSRNPAVIALGRPLFNDEKVWTGTFGGPLFLPRFGEGGPAIDTERGKNFFFFAFQHYRYRSPGATQNLITPTAAGRATLQPFAATNPNVAAYLAATANTVATIVNQPSVSLDPVGGPVSRGSVEIGTFIRSYTSTSNQNQYQFRTDHNIGQNDQLSFRFLYDNQLQPFGGAVGFPGFEADYSAKYRNFLISETHVFSSTMTNELRLAYNRIQLGFPVADASGPAGTLPQITITGSNLTALGTSSNFPQGRTADNYQVQDTVTKIFGNHTIRAGVDYLRQISTQTAPANIRGSLTYAATTNFTSLANFVDNFGGSGGAASRTFGDATYFPKLHRVAVFAQDRWKATDNLTVSIGLRYERFGEPFNTLRTPAFSGLFTVDPATRQGPYSEPNQVQPDTNNFAPTFGITYSPSFTDGIRGFIFGDRKTVIRLGYNIGYDSFFNNIASNAVASSPNTIVTTQSSTVSAANPRGIPNFSTAFPTTAAVVLPTSQQFLIAPDLKNPYYQRWSFGIQRALPLKLVMDLSYVGSKGTHLFASEDYNPLVRPELRITPAGYPRCDLTGNTTVTAAQATAQFPAGTPCPTTGRLDNIQGARVVRTNGGSSYYHSGQFELRRRFADNFLATVAYTFSKNMSNIEDPINASGAITTVTGNGVSSIPSIFGGLKNDYALSIDDRTHRLALTYVVESPFFREQKGILGRLLGGFQLSGVTTFESGVPFTVFNGFDSDGIGGGQDRPTFNPNGQRGVRAVPEVNAQGFIVRYFNPEIKDATGAFQTIDPSTAQFIVNPAYVAGLAGSVVRVGNLGRNTERTPPVYLTNLNLMKRTRLTEKIFLEARTELFNAFNTPNFPTAASGLTNQITSVANAQTQGLFLNPDTVNTSGGGRVVRYQLKLVF